MASKKEPWDPAKKPGGKEPADNDAPPPHDGGQVRVALESYLRLRRRVEREATPSAHVVASRFSGEAGPEAAAFEATLVIRRDGWAEGSAAVALFPAGVAVLGFEGPDSVYLTSEYGRTSAVLTRPGQHTVKIKLVVGYLADSAGRGLVLPLPPAPGHELEFSVPERERTVRVVPAVEVRRQDTQGEASKVTACVGSVEEVRIEWLGERREKPLVRGVVASVAAFGDNVLSLATRIEYEVRRAGVESLDLELPGSVEFLGAEAENLRRWEITEGGGGRRRLQLLFTREVLGDLAVTLYWEAELADGVPVVEVPRIHLRGVERESGYLAVEARTNIEVAEESVERASAVDVRELPRAAWDLCQGPPLLAYKYLDAACRVAVKLVRHKELEVLVAAVDRAFCQGVLVEEGQMETLLRLEVRNNQKQFLRLALPRDSVLWGAFVAGKPVKPAVESDGRWTLIALEKSVSTEGKERAFPVEIVYISQVGRLDRSGELKLFLPAVDMPINHLFYRLFLPDACKYWGFAGQLQEVQEFSHAWPGSAATPAAIENIAAAGGGEPYPMQQRAEINLPMAGMAAQEPEPLPQKLRAQAGKYQRGVQPVRIEPPKIGFEKRFEKLLLLEGSCEVRFSYKRRWGR